MWHSSVEYWVCYRMFHSKRMKVFPRVAWPSLFKAGDVTNWYQSMRDFSGVAFPSLWVAGGRYNREKCMWSISARYQNCAQWILAHNAKVVHASCQRDGEEMHSGYRCAETRFTL
jgi:hypothetical protein